VEWAGSGENVEVSISNGKDTIAKVPAQVVPVVKAERRERLFHEHRPGWQQVADGKFL